MSEAEVTPKKIEDDRTYLKDSISTITKTFDNVIKNFKQGGEGMNEKNKLLKSVKDECALILNKLDNEDDKKENEEIVHYYEEKEKEKEELKNQIKIKITNISNGNKVTIQL